MTVNVNNLVQSDLQGIVPENAFILRFFGKTVHQLIGSPFYCKATGSLMQTKISGTTKYFNLVQVSQTESTVTIKSFSSEKIYYSSLIFHVFAEVRDETYFNISSPALITSTFALLKYLL